MNIWGLGDCLGCLQKRSDYCHTSNENRHVRNFTHVMFHKKSFTAIEGYLAHLNCYKNLSNSFCCSELFQEQTFIFIFFVISLFEKFFPMERGSQFHLQPYFWKVTQHFLPCLPTCDRISLATVADQSILNLFSILVINGRNRIKTNKQTNKICYLRSKFARYLFIYLFILDLISLR